MHWSNRRESFSKEVGRLLVIRGIEKADEGQGGYQEGSVFGVGLDRWFRNPQ